MKSGRLEAFSDGVLAIIITIMVLQMQVPEGASFVSLKPMFPVFLSYVLSFTYVGIYWNNHHHLLQAITNVNGKILWANLILLFVLSLIPFTTAWMGKNVLESPPTALYGINLLLCAIAFNVLEVVAIKHEGKESKIGMALRNHIKEYASIALYSIGVLLSFFIPVISIACYTAVAVLWIVPDNRIEKQIK